MLLGLICINQIISPVTPFSTPFLGLRTFFTFFQFLRGPRSRLLREPRQRRLFRVLCLPSDSCKSSSVGVSWSAAETEARFETLELPLRPGNHLQRKSAGLRSQRRFLRKLILLNNNLLSVRLLFKIWIQSLNYFKNFRLLKEMKWCFKSKLYSEYFHNFDG